MKHDNDLTTKQFGDACEHLVLSELMLAKWPAHKMPDGWPGYDLTVSRGIDADEHVSVKGRRVGVGRAAKSWRFAPTGWDWLALVSINMDNHGRSIYIVPRDWAMANSYPLSTGNRRLGITNRALERFRNNFNLNRSPPAPR